MIQNTRQSTENLIVWQSLHKKVYGYSPCEGESRWFIELDTLADQFEEIGEMAVRAHNKKPDNSLCNIRS